MKKNTALNSSNKVSIRHTGSSCFTVLLRCYTRDNLKFKKSFVILFTQHFIFRIIYVLQNLLWNKLLLALFCKYVYVVTKEIN